MPDLFSISKLKIFFILVSLSLTSPAFSQSDDEEVEIDTTVITSIQQEDVEEFTFDNITGNAPAAIPRELPDSVYDNLRKDQDYWYVNLPPPRQKPKVENKEPEYQPGWMQSKGVRNFVLFL